MRLSRCHGVTLIELIVFIVVVSIALVTLLSVYNQAVINSVDPIVRVRALECAQTKLDEILARKFDENTPSGGVPACDAFAGLACNGIAADAGRDDVGDYHTDDGAVIAGCTFDITVTAAAVGGVPAAQSRLVTVAATSASSTVTLSSYRMNF